MSYRLRLLGLQLSNHKATVTHQKCTNIWNFDFDPLRVELGPYGSLVDKKNSHNNCHVRTWLVFNRNETIFYMPLTNMQKSV